MPIAARYLPKVAPHNNKQQVNLGGVLLIFPAYEYICTMDMSLVRIYYSWFPRRDCPTTAGSTPPIRTGLVDLG